MLHAGNRMQRENGPGLRGLIRILLFLGPDAVQWFGRLIRSSSVSVSGLCRYSDGPLAIVIGLAAVIIGEAVFGKIFHNFGFRLLGVALGSIIYYLVLAGGYLDGN